MSYLTLTNKYKKAVSSEAAFFFGVGMKSIIGLLYPKAVKICVREALLWNCIYFGFDSDLFDDSVYGEESYFA